MLLLVQRKVIFISLISVLEISFKRSLKPTKVVSGPLMFVVTLREWCPVVQMEMSSFGRYVHWFPKENETSLNWWLKKVVTPKSWILYKQEHWRCQRMCFVSNTVTFSMEMHPNCWCVLPSWILLSRYRTRTVLKWIDFLWRFTVLLLVLIWSQTSCAYHVYFLW